MESKKPVVLSVREVSQILRLGRQKVYILIEEGALEGVKVGHDWRVPVRSVEDLVGPLPEEYFISVGLNAA